jgi:hypothetical protein
MLDIGMIPPAREQAIEASKREGSAYALISGRYGEPDECIAIYGGSAKGLAGATKEAEQQRGEFQFARLEQYQCGRLAQHIPVFGDD